jgi:hypothetical protein
MLPVSATFFCPNPTAGSAVDISNCISQQMGAARPGAVQPTPPRRRAASRLIATLDTQEVAAAVERLKSGFGLRVVK